MARFPSLSKTPADLLHQKLLDDFAAYEETPDAIEYGLRLDVADLLIRRMAVANLSQKQLADMVGVKAPVISKIINAKQNLTIKTICRLLSGLGVKPRLLEFDDKTNSVVLMDGTIVSLIKADESHGQEECTSLSTGGSFKFSDHFSTDNAGKAVDGRRSKSNTAPSSDAMVRFDVSVLAG